MTVFIRLTEVPVEEKPERLRRAVAGDGQIFEVDPHAFSAVPGSPFAYWGIPALRRAFSDFLPFGTNGRAGLVGASTKDDFRFLRLSWEQPDGRGSRWIGHIKGGARATYFRDVQWAINWHSEGRELKAFAEHRTNEMYGKPSWSRWLAAATYYRRPGLTWPLRGVRFSSQAAPSECIFSVAGKMAVVPGDELLPWLALFNSTIFDALILFFAGKVGGVQYESGLIDKIPVPSFSDSAADGLARLARRAWALKRALDTTNETSHAFLLPPGINERRTGLDRGAVETEVDAIQRQIDDVAFDLYRISPEDRAAIERSTKWNASAGDDLNEADRDDSAEEPADEDSTPVATSEALLFWLVGVAYGRFDPRLATGERAIPPEPAPFDALPTRSPGMYPEGEEPADRPDILVDDDGHVDDLIARALTIAERVRVNVPENLRGWLAKEFFPLHIKIYSKSRRKAPIYWQLATPSACYSVWLYIHASGKDTLFRVQNDYAAPKLAHEERRLESFTSELRDGATATQRKQLAAQENVVEELRAFLEEVKRVTPLWNPDLDDGVIINFAPLWRLVPHHKTWQKELKAIWDALCEGKYDWSHLAMHLWPERVVPKCAKDRSLAIAHGLEDMFWIEGSDGKWTPRKTPTRSVDEFVCERTSPAVKAALKSLLEAPAATGSAKKTKKGKANA